MRQITIRLTKDGTVLGRALKKRGELVQVDPATAHELVAEGRAVFITTVRARYDNVLIGSRSCSKGEEVELPEDLAVLAHNMGKATILDPSTMLSQDGRAALRDPPPLPAPRAGPRSPYDDEPWVTVRFLQPIGGMLVWNKWVNASEDGVISIPRCLAEAAVKDRFAEWTGPAAVREFIMNAIDLTKPRDSRPAPIPSLRGSP